MQTSDEELAERLTSRVCVDPNGAIKWYDSRDMIHRVHGPAIIYPDGTQMWYRDGLPHRDGGPAVIMEHAQYWAQMGELHRVDGPASIWSDGRVEWYLNGQRVSEDEHRLRTGRS